ncbi:MAG: hypothetical protein Q8922_04765 [Bacteroidota bacterium]|nr:hypothetical protein [Bacteroidota bacterium]MDP4231983.1 hypothetical protein [Bacteroidota bacterium]MDP4241310.1 hypothetical protein [Bacteroidota bacterium]MDP4287231.1 hypothetical protein [Bacteroidota bacterium]
MKRLLSTHLALLCFVASSHPAHAQGGSWTTVLSGYYGASFRALTSDTLLYIKSATVSEYAVMSSTNGGQTWDSSEVGYCFHDHPGGFLPVTVEGSSVNDCYVGGYVDSIIYDPDWREEVYPAIRHTTDRGKTWTDYVTIKAGLLDRSSGDYFFNIKLMPSGNIIWNTNTDVVGWPSLLLVDQGKITTLLGNPGKQIGIFDFRDESTGMAWVGSTELIRTTDGGIHWDTIMHQRLPWSQGGYWSVKYLKWETWFAVQDSLVYSTTDDGQTWCDSMRIPFPWGMATCNSSRHLGFLLPGDGAPYFYGTSNGLIWERLETPDTLPNPTAYAGDRNTLYYATSRGLFRSRVAGGLGVALSQVPKSNISISLNPASNTATVGLEPSNGPRMLTLCDLLGRAVAREQIGSGVRSVSIDVHDLAAGLYVIEVDGEFSKILIER